MNTQILEQIGLTKTETKLYLALLRMGTSTTTVLVRESGIHASKVYEFLDKLIEKGLVAYTIQANKKHFSACDPQFLQEFLKEKQRKIEEQKEQVADLLPALESLQKEGGPIPFKVYEGLRGVKSFYEHLLLVLDPGDTSHLWGAPKIGNDKLEGYLLDWHVRRQKKGIRLRALYEAGNREYGELRAKMKHSSVRYLPKSMQSSPIWVEISNNILGIGRIKGDKAFIFTIEDPEIARGMLDYFNLLWSMSGR